MTGEQSRSQIKQLLQQEYDRMERRLRNAEEKNLFLARENQYYVNKEYKGADPFINQET